MSIVRKIRNHSASSPSRRRRDIARALAAAPTPASREELHMFQNR